jgi:hypothetical protein
LIYTLDPLVDLRWEEFLNRAPRASAFHSSGWLRALFHTYHYAPIVFTSTPPNRALENGTVFTIVKSWLVDSRLVSLPFSDHVDPLMQREEDLVELLFDLRKGQQSGRWKRVELRPTTVGNYNPAWPIFFDGQRFIQQQVDLRPNLETVFSRFHHDSIRRKIRKAERSGVVEEVGQSEELLQQFFSLHTKTRRRKSLPPPPLLWFRNILEYLKEKATIRVASKDGKPIAAILTLRFKETAVYKYGCTDSRFHNLGAMPFLLWKAMEQEHRTGAKEFDLGRTGPDNMGLIRFKEKFGAVRTDVTYKIFPEESRPAMENDWRLSLAKKIFRFLPEKAMVYAGSKIYPHIG